MTLAKKSDEEHIEKYCVHSSSWFYHFLMRLRVDMDA